MIDPRPIISLCLTSLFLIGCATTDGPVSVPAPYQPPTQTRTDPPPNTQIYRPERKPQRPVATGLRLPHMEGRDVVRLALLLPFSAKNEGLREQARSMLNAAQLAVFEANDHRLVLIPKDTAGTEQGARDATRSAIIDGADLLIGPLLSRAVSGASAEARPYRIPIIAFSTDSSVAGNGVYLLNFQPEVEVARIIDYAVSQELYSFGLLRGQNAYGERIEAAMHQSVAANAAQITDVQLYARSPEQMNAPVAQLAHTKARKDAINVWEENGGVGDPALDPEFLFELPYQAVLIPESGIRLQSLAPLLPYYDVDPRKTRFLGTRGWYDQSLTREPALNGGWFVGPDPTSLDVFTTAYTQAFSHKPKRLAPLVYDAIRVADLIVETNHGQSFVQTNQLQDPRGFTGATGLFRFNENGLAEHQLAVYEMKRGRFEVIDPAATTFEPVGF